MRFQTLVARLVGVLALSGCQLYFAQPHGPPDAPEGCGGCDSGGEVCPTYQPGGHCFNQSLSCSYGGDACGLNQTTCSCVGDAWACNGPGIPDIDAGQPTCGVIEAEHVPNHTDWTVSCGGVDHGDESLTADVINATMSFSFTGTALDVYYEKGPNDGAFSVTVDAAAPVIVNAYQPGSFTFQNPTTIASGLADEPHTATLTCTSLYCDIDYFNVACD